MVRCRARPNLATGVFRDMQGAVVLVVQNGSAPTNAEWDPYLANTRSCLGACSAVGLALTDGGTPKRIAAGARQRGARGPLPAVCRGVQ